MVVCGILTLKYWATHVETYFLKSRFLSSSHRRELENSMELSQNKEGKGMLWTRKFL